MKRKILITAFEPFLGEAINPSQILLENIKKEFSISPESELVETLLLPVSFARAGEVLERHLSANRYETVLLLGQAGGRAEISLERVALNWIENEKPDEDGVRPPQGNIKAESSLALFSSLPLTEWKEQLQAQGMPVGISLSAGGYVCNYVYYKALDLLQTQQGSSQICFIHVPYLPEQVVNKPVGTPSMDLKTMQAALQAIVSIAAKSI